MRKFLWVLSIFFVKAGIILAQNTNTFNINQYGDFANVAMDSFMATEAENLVLSTQNSDTDFANYSFPVNGKSQQNIDPGIQPELDYFSAVKFSIDGSKFFVVGRYSNVVTVFDAITLDTIINIPVGNGGMNIDLNETTAVVTCMYDDLITVIDLIDYSTVNVPTSNEPILVKISPDGNFAYVGCDNPDVCNIVDLATPQVIATINDFPVDKISESYSSGNGRKVFYYNDFYMSKGGDYVIAVKINEGIRFYETQTNTLETIVPVSGCRKIGISPDTTKVFTLSWLSSTNQLAYRIDAINKTILGSPVAIPDGMNGYPGIVSNDDGKKIYLGTNGNHGTLINFTTGTSTTFPSIMSSAWIETSPDHQYAIHGTANFSIINFATETIMDTETAYSCSGGAISPTQNRAVIFDAFRREYVISYDFTNPANITFLGAAMPADLNKEADAPYRVNVSSDGTKVVTINQLSESVTIFNLLTNSIDTIICFPINSGIKDVAITHNSDYAVISFESSMTAIIDLTTNTIVKEITGGSGQTVRITPNDEYAYISNVSGTDKVNVIQLDGANSSYVTGINTGQMGIFWLHYGITSDIRIDPTGNYCAVAVSFDNKVKIINLSTNTIVQELTGFNFPLQLAFNSAGTKLAVTNKDGNSVSIINFNGASSTVQGTYSYGTLPLRLGYNSVTDEFFVCNHTDKNVVKIDPATGNFTGVLPFTGYPVQVDFDLLGNSIVLLNNIGSTASIVNSSGETYDIPYSVSYFDNNNDITAVVSPGPDNLSIIYWPTAVLPFTNLSVKVFLEGPYNDGTNLMNTTVNSAGLLPMAQPYGPTLPYYGNNFPIWYYNGSESVSDFNPSVVDWVMLEIRDASTPENANSTAIVQKFPGLLMSDGSVRALDGVSDLNITETISKGCFVVIHHRNHLSIINSTPLIKVGNTYSWDFTTSSAQAYGGTAAQKQLESGVWGMFTADGNADGQVDAFDKLSVWYLDGGKYGYRGSDYNLDGQVDNLDKNDEWLPGQGINSSQVPD